MNNFFLITVLFFQALGLQLSAQTPEWDNPQVVQENEIKPHSNFYHYPNMKVASKFDKWGLTWMLTLDGNWQYNYALKASDIPHDFPLPDFDASKWGIVHIPSIHKNIKTGINASFPYLPHDGNQVSSFRKVFPIPENWYGQQIILHFSGAGSGFYVWLNGRRVGYSETGNCGSEFNVTPFIKFGRMNILAVQTYALTDDMWLNANDSISNTGIYRDIFIYAVPNLSIFDYTVETSIDSGNGKLNVTIVPKRYLQSIDGKFKIVLSLLDKDGKDMFTPVEKIYKPAKAEDSIIEIDQLVNQIKAWNLGEPNLYSLLIELKDKDNQTIEVVGSKIGFRNVNFNDSAIIVNDISTNFSEIKQLPVIDSNSQAIKTISQLKKNKNYIVKTSNTPIDPETLNLFDINGICVIENIPFEIEDKNIASIGNESQWRDHIISRVKKITARDKNHPSIIEFQIDKNLKGKNFEIARKLLK
jgi:beta-galactosidase